jgi:DNA-binding response OmpR family regulator
MRILLLKDDLSLGSTIQSWLQLDGYAVDWAQRETMPTQPCVRMLMNVYCPIAGCQG